MASAQKTAALKTAARTFGTQLSHQLKVDALKAELVTHNEMRVSSLTKEYIAIRKEKEQAQAVLSEIQVRLDAVTQLLFEQMSAEEISSVKLDGGRAISAWLEPYASVRDPEAFRVWCLEQGFERKMHLHPSTLRELVNQRLERGEEEPPGIAIFSKPVIRLGSER